MKTDRVTPDAPRFIVSVELRIIPEKTYTCPAFRIMGSVWDSDAPFAVVEEE